MKVWSSNKIFVSDDPPCRLLRFRTPEGDLSTTIERTDRGVISKLTCEYWLIQFLLWGNEAFCSQLEYRQSFRSGGLRIMPPRTVPMTVRIDTGGGAYGNYLRDQRVDDRSPDQAAIDRRL